jgi:hypothetical protein
MRLLAKHPTLVLGVAVLASVALAASGCGGSKSPSVASFGSTTSSTVAAPTAGIAQLDEYGACMRTHGLPQYQNPVKNGNQILFPTGVNLTSPQYQDAEAACGELLPARFEPSTNRAVPQADRSDYLRTAACIRSHGFPTFPDPTFTASGVHFTTPPRTDVSSSHFQDALATCRKLIPPGLPYSN